MPFLLEPPASRYEKTYQTGSKRRHWLIGGLVAAIGVLGMAIAFWVFARPPLLALLGSSELVTPVGSSNPQATPSVIPSPTPEPEDSFTILVMGRGGAGHDGGALTDTMLLVKILLEQKRIVMLSIPRDLYVSIPYDGNEHYNKINSAYAFGIDQHNYPNKLEQYKENSGGGELAKDVVTRLTDVPIDRYITIDFSGFEQAIDLIGGVEINVERAFTDYEYPIAGREKADCSQPQEKTEHTPTSLQELIEQGQLNHETLPKLPKEFPCRYEMLHFDAGLQTMDGKTALKYVRSRHSAEEGSDFSRSRRQKLLIQAVTNKLFSLGQITKLPSFLNTLRSHVDTDLSAVDFASWTPKANEIREYPITSLALSTENYLWEGFSSDRQFILRPKAGIGNYTAIKDWLSSYLLPNPELNYPLIEIQSTVQSASRAGELRQKLEQENFPIKMSLSSTKAGEQVDSLTIYNQKVASTALQKIREIANIAADNIATKSAKNSTSDLLIMLP